MEFAVEHTLLFDMESNRGIIVAYEMINGERKNFREANAKELIDIVNGYKNWMKVKDQFKNNNQLEILNGQ